ncbi:MAG: hypothetical protein RRZ65_06975 [Tannerellaceae bacterium]
MNTTNQTQTTDPLEDLFKQLPDKELPASFRFNVMQQVMAESTRLKKRSERLGLLAVILTSLAMVGLTILLLWYMDLPALSLSTPNVSACSFYLYIGTLTLLLLFADYKLRRLFHKDE